MASVRPDPQSLYQEDYYAWALDQAAMLRRLASEGSNVPLDLVNLAEEVEDLGGNQWHTITSHAANVIEHLLKLEYSPATAPCNGWEVTVLKSRAEIEAHLTKTLRRRLEQEWLMVGRRGLRAGALGLKLDQISASLLPLECPYSVEQVLDQDWLPVNRHGLVD